jgi:hydroxymethylpyrimidine/phosphomethylpyrimidine kinase
MDLKHQKAKQNKATTKAEEDRKAAQVNTIVHNIDINIMSVGLLTQTTNVPTLLGWLSDADVAWVLAQSTLCW